MADEKSKDTDMWTMINRELSLMDMARGDVSYAHENIDNEILANTLDEIYRSSLRSGPFSEYTDVIYEGETRKGEPRYMHQYVEGLPTQDRFVAQHDALRRLLQADPTFADTLSREEAMKRVAPQEGFMKRLAKMLGF